MRRTIACGVLLLAACLAPRSIAGEAAPDQSSVHSYWLRRREPGGTLCWIHLMPTILRAGPYRVYFYSHEPNEPPHVHVDRDAQSAKFWLDPVALARNLGFGAKELSRIERVVTENEDACLEAWNEYFGK